MKLEYVPGATPLDLDDIMGLIPDHITTQAELNEWEQANILDAEIWFSNHFNNIKKNKGIIKQSILPDIFNFLEARSIQQIHKKMFDKTWRWAGKFRKSNKNIGVDWIHIPIRLHQLLEDIKYQCQNQIYPIEEIAVRLHHRLVAIHLFPNGNGRHARFAADLFLELHNVQKFSWGENNLYDNSAIRKKYIQALQAADKHDYEALLKFMKR